MLQLQSTFLSHQSLTLSTSFLFTCVPVICLYRLTKNRTRTNAARTSWIYRQLALVHNSYECEQLPLDSIKFLVSRNSYTSTQTCTHVSANAPWETLKLRRDNHCDKPQPVVESTCNSSRGCRPRMTDHILEVRQCSEDQTCAGVRAVLAVTSPSKTITASRRVTLVDTVQILTTKYTSYKFKINCN